MPRCENPKCGRDVTAVRRIVIAGDYDASLKRPVFLCDDCSNAKLRELRERGFHIADGVFAGEAGAPGAGEER